MSELNIHKEIHVPVTLFVYSFVMFFMYTLFEKMLKISENFEMKFSMSAL